MQIIINLNPDPYPIDPNPNPASPHILHVLICKTAYVCCFVINQPLHVKFRLDMGTAWGSTR